MKIFDAVLSHIAPYDCLSCGEEGALLCADCIPLLGTQITSRCFRCQKMTQDFKVCDSCRTTAGISRVSMKYVYSGYTKALIKEFKFGGKRAAAREIAQLMQDLLPRTPDVILVHIPTASGRMRQRGYDHAKLLADSLAALTGKVHLSLLARTSQQRQLGAGRSERLKNIAGAFRVTGSAEGAHIILVDDVVTTGATLAEAAKVLRLAGARNVEAVVFAQTVL